MDLARHLNRGADTLTAKHSRNFNHLMTTYLARHHNRRVEHLISKPHMQRFTRYLTRPVGGNLIRKHSRSVEHLYNKLHMKSLNRSMPHLVGGNLIGHHNWRIEHSQLHLLGFNRYLAPPV